VDGAQKEGVGRDPLERSKGERKEVRPLGETVIVEVEPFRREKSGEVEFFVVRVLGAERDFGGRRVFVDGTPLDPALYYFEAVEVVLVDYNEDDICNEARIYTASGSTGEGA
jgi:hypothetical protein